MNGRLVARLAGGLPDGVPAVRLVAVGRVVHAAPVADGSVWWTVCGVVTPARSVVDLDGPGCELCAAKLDRQAREWPAGAGRGAGGRRPGGLVGRVAAWWVSAVEARRAAVELGAVDVAAGADGGRVWRDERLVGRR